jgi:hypothetical protein
MSAELKRANSFHSWGPPTPYTVVIAKKISESDSWNAVTIRSTIERRMEREGIATEYLGEFVKAPVQIVLRAFSLHPGIVYNPALYPDD